MVIFLDDTKTSTTIHIHKMRQRLGILSTTAMIRRTRSWKSIVMAATTSFSGLAGRSLWYPFYSTWSLLSTRNRTSSFASATPLKDDDYDNRSKNETYHHQRIPMLSSYDPATGDLLGEVPISSSDIIQSTIDTAYATQCSIWSMYSLWDRVAAIQHAYKKVEPFQDGISQLLSMEMGKDLSRSRKEVRGALRSGPYYAKEAAEALQPQPLGRGGSTLYYIPYGVTVVISPWNYPVMMANNLIVPALVAGNTVVLKPSEETPLVAQEFFGRLAASLPDGVLSILHGDGPTVGQPLVDSPKTHMIAFTGSQATGRTIMSRSSLRLKRLVMELGGNDPLIVLEDANLEQAAKFVVAGGLENAGQMCTSMERVYVHESVSEKLERFIVRYAGRYQVGPWNSSSTGSPFQFIGPIINSKQHAKILEHIEDAHVKGGRFLTVGGTAVDDFTQQEPPYIRPTFVADMTRDMLLEQDETFGPVVGIATFSTLDEVIERANDSEYGLGAVVFGYQHAQQVASRLEAGMVGINQGQGGPGPWVGAKQSGFGYHGTPEGHRQFAQAKVISGEIQR